jgi:hypothetical protein
MLYSEIIAVCSQIHTKHINTLCGQNVELVNVKLVVHITSGIPRQTAKQWTKISPGDQRRHGWCNNYSFGDLSCLRRQSEPNWSPKRWLSMAVRTW